MGIETAIMAGGAALGGIGGFLGSKKKPQITTQNSTSTSAPWEPQQQYLTSGFSDGLGALKDAQALGPYRGDFVSGPNANLNAGWDRSVAFSNYAQPFGQNMMNAGQAGVDQFGNVIGNANTLFNQAGVDPTQRTIANAGSFADNPYLNSQIQAATRDVNQNLQLGRAQNNANASGTGNMNSTRAGVTEAILTKAAQDRVGDISANMRGQAYNNGLQLAAQQGQQQFANALNANQQGLAASTAGAGLVNQGFGLTNQAINNQTAVGAQQRDIQNQVNQGNLQQNEYLRNSDLDLIKKYMGIVGGSYGGTTSSSGTGTMTAPQGNPIMGALQGAVGGAMQGYGLGNAMGFGGGYSNPAGFFGAPGSPYAYGAAGYTGYGPYQ